MSGHNLSVVLLIRLRSFKTSGIVPYKPGASGFNLANTLPRSAWGLEAVQRFLSTGPCNSSPVDGIGVSNRFFASASSFSKEACNTSRHLEAAFAERTFAPPLFDRSFLAAILPVQTGHWSSSCKSDAVCGRNKNNFLRSSVAKELTCVERRRRDA